MHGIFFRVRTRSSFAAETLQQSRLVKCSLLDSEVPLSPIKLVEPLPLQQNIAGNVKLVYGTDKTIGLDSRSMCTGNVYWYTGLLTYKTVMLCQPW